MAYYDTTYTNGVIASREKYLLKDKLLRLCELNAEEAFRMLVESGYGGGASVAASVYEYENLIAVEESNLDAFIREYAPSETEKTYLLSPRDFHNAKALVKATYLSTDADKLLAPVGLVSIDLISSCVANKNFTPITAFNAYLGRACEDATALLEENPSGSKLGEIFDKAMYSYLFSVCKRKKILRDILIAKADMTNILTALRSGEEELAKEKYLPVGSLSTEKLSALFLADCEKAIKAFSDTPYADFVKACFAALSKREPMTQAERILASYDTEYFSARKYELTKNEPFLYYVYRKKTENANVRILFVCLLAGLDEYAVKKRLRAL